MAVVLAGIWTGHHLGGFAWQSDPKHQFNWHPLLMTLGMIYLYGNGMYRVWHPNCTPYSSIWGAIWVPHTVVFTYLLNM